MSPAFTFFIGLLFLVLFGWYFATDYGLRKRLIATLLAVLLPYFAYTRWRQYREIWAYVEGESCRRRASMLASASPMSKSTSVAGSIVG